MSIQKRAKVLVVDDSPLVRRIIHDILDNHPMIEVVGTAANAHIAEIKVRQLDPHVLTLDIEMPGMNGLEFLKRLMSRNPKPVIMMSVFTQRGTETTFQALDYGAFDFVPKPSAVINLSHEEIGKDLVNKILTAYNSQYVKKFNSWSLNNETTVAQLIKEKDKSVATEEKLKLAEQAPDKIWDRDVYTPQNKDELVKAKLKTLTLPSTSYLEPPQKLSGEKIKAHFVLIGTSTGGPNALAKLVPQLPEDFPLPVLVVQHMPMGFTKAFAQRLDSLSAVSFKEAEEGDILRPGWGYVAPGDHHLQIVEKKGRFEAKVQQESPVNGHRPSIDVLFNSVLPFLDSPGRAIGIILTGMGRDGADGLRKMHTKGAWCIAQDERSSAVFGMNRESVLMDAVDAVGSLDQIIPWILAKL